MRTLASFIAEAGRLDAVDAVGWVVRLAKTLESLHGMGLAHGRLSTAAIHADQDSCLGAGALVGRDLSDDVGYYSPDRASGGGEAPESDTWAAAVILYESLTGARPFTADTDAQLRAQIAGLPPAPLSELGVDDEELQDVLDLAFSPNLQRRITTLQELREMLETWNAAWAKLPPLQLGVDTADEGDGDDVPDDAVTDKIDDLVAATRESLIRAGAFPSATAERSGDDGVLVPAEEDEDEAPTQLADVDIGALMATELLAPDDDADEAPAAAPARSEPLAALADDGEGPSAEGDDDDEVPTELADIDVGQLIAQAEQAARSEPPEQLAERPDPAQQISQGDGIEDVAADGAIEVAPVDAAEVEFDRHDLETDDECDLESPEALPQSSPLPPPLPPEASSPGLAEPPSAPASAVAAQASPTREPLLSDDEAESRRPRRSRRAALFVLLALVGAAVGILVFRPGVFRQLWSGAPLGSPVASAPQRTAGPAEGASSSPAAPLPAAGGEGGAADPPESSATGSAGAGGGPPGTASAAADAGAAGATGASASAVATASSQAVADGAGASSTAAASAPSAAAQAGMPAGLSTCVAGLFPPDSFAGTSPDFGFVCTEVNPRKGASELKTLVVRAGGGQRGVTVAMQEWAVLGWYEMAAFAVVRSMCCNEPPPLQTPASLAYCKLAPALAAISGRVIGKDEVALRAAVGEYATALRCLYQVGASSVFGLKGRSQGGEAATFEKTLARARKAYRSR